MNSIVQLFAPFHDFVRHHHAIHGVFIGTHILALMIGGGLAIAADRLTLRVGDRDVDGRRARLDEVRDVHVIVLWGLIFLFISGFLLLAAEIDNFPTSPVFWIKMVLIGLLLANGLALNRMEKNLRGSLGAGRPVVSDEDWGRVRMFSRFSRALWIVTAVVGVLLSIVA